APAPWWGRSWTASRARPRARSWAAGRARAWCWRREGRKSPSRRAPAGASAWRVRSWWTALPARARSAREVLDHPRTVPKTGEVIARRDSARPPRTERRRRRWGVQRSPRQRLAFDVVAGLVLGAIVSAWAFSIVSAY